MIGIVLALVIALGAVVLTEGMDQTVRGSRDVRRVLDVAPLAVIPDIQDAPCHAAPSFSDGIAGRPCTLIGSFDCGHDHAELVLT